MSPAFGACSKLFSDIQTPSIDSNVNLNTNSVHQPQSSSFSFGGNECNQGFNFDFHGMVPAYSEQSRGRRIRYPLKKFRRKVEVQHTKFVDSLSSESLDRSNETGTSSVSAPNVSNNSVCGGNVVGEKGGHERKFCSVECTSGTEGNSMASSLSWSSSNFETRSSSSKFEFGAGKSCEELNQNKGYGAKDNGLKSNFLNLKNEHVVFGAQNNSSGAVFAEGSNMKSTSRFVNGACGDNACDSAMKSGMGDGNFMFTASMEGNSSSIKFEQETLNGTAGLSKPQKMQNCSFVLGATKGELDSDGNLNHKGSVNRSGMQSEVDRSGKFGRVDSVSNGNKTSVAAENSYKKLQTEVCAGSVWKTVPNVTCKVRLDVEDISAKHGRSSFVSSTGINGGERNDNSFVFGAKGNGSASIANVKKGNHSDYASSKDFLHKSKVNVETTDDLNGGFVSGAGINEKLSSNGNMESRNSKIHLRDENIKSSSESMKSLNDGTMSNFKSVAGSSQTPGDTFYKIPLSKLLDEMKNLSIDDSKGRTCSEQVRDTSSNSHFCSDHLEPTQNNGQMSSEGKSVTPFQDQNKDANVDNGVKSSDPVKAGTESFNHGTHEYEHHSKPDIYFSGSVKPRQSVPTKNTNSMTNVEVTCEGVSFPFVFVKENQPSNSNENFVHVDQNYSCFGAPPTKVENTENLGFTCMPVEPRTFFNEFTAADTNESSATNLFTKSNKKIELCATAKEKKLKKTRRKSRQRLPAKTSTGKSHLYNEGSSPKNFESPDGFSPINISSYQCSTDGVPSLATKMKEGESTFGSQRFLADENGKKAVEPGSVNYKDLNGSNMMSAPSSSAQDGLSSIRRQYRKKYKLKIGNGLTGKTVAGSGEFSSLACSSNGNITKVQSGVAPNYHKNDREYAEQDTPEITTKGVSEHWRIRGNQAYKSGDFSKAEEFYTKGINSVKGDNVSGISGQQLSLCYSNRAATLMSLGRMREALVDCKSAASLDPSFHKVKMRAANCHLLLGEFQEAMQYYNECLKFDNKVCLDRRFTVEAADGLHKAQKVAEFLSQCAELMQLRTSDAANIALIVLADALSISCYSEQLLEMKGEALLLLQRYDEVIDLCEQTLHSAEKNVRCNHLSNLADCHCKNSPRLWRWHLMLKSHFYLGRLEMALGLIEKLEDLKLYSSGGGANPETPIALAVTIRGLLEHKKAGNEAFQSGKHLEAIEHYTAAISGSVECRPFAAICFCNRAAAHQALGQIVDAIADCSLAMALDGNYPKAVSRRATLHEMIKDYRQAIDDLQRLVTILENQLKEQQSRKENGSSSSKKELKLAHQRLSLMEDMANKGTSLELYLILGIKESDTEAEIKKAYRKAALRHHPDKVGQFLARNDSGDDGRLWKDIVEKVHEDADRLFKMIGEAYAVLSDPDKRSKYNDEREIRDFCNSSSSSRNTNFRRPSDYNSYAYDGSSRYNRHSNFYSSPYGRSRNRQYWP